jgi:hypothetical protein
MKNDIIIDYTKDNHFAELKEAELLRERLQTLDQISQYVGTYFSKDYVMKNVLGFTEEDVEKMQDDAKKNQERIDQATDDEEPQEEEVEVEPDLVISEDTIIKELESEVKLKELEVLDSINKSLKK